MLKKLICLIRGHSWRYLENFTADEWDWVCDRCGKHVVIHSKEE